jgi:hypothetical protein
VPVPTVRAAPGEAAPLASDPVVSLPREAPLDEALAALHRSLGVPVLCEKPRIDRLLQAELKAAALPGALEEVSRSYHLYCVRRERSLSFQRRYADARERPDLEVQLLTAIARDVFRLLDAVAPGPLDASEQREHASFFAALSSDEVEQARTRGLPFRALDPKQQALWKRINYRMAYSNAWMEGRRSAQLYNTWNQGRLEYAPGADGQPILWYRFPDPVEDSSLTVPLNAVPRLPPVRVVPAGENRVDGSARPPAGWERRSQIPEGETTVKKVADALSAAAGKPFEIDPYTAERPLLVYASGARVRDVVEALRELYGWSVVPRAKGGWHLGRVAPAGAIDPVELHARLRAALPPAIFHLWSNNEGDLAYTARQVHLRDVLLARLNAAKPKWTRFDVRDMDQETQVVLANLLCDRQIRPSIRYVTNIPAPYAWIARQEEGVFGLDGEPGPGKHPNFWFGVRRPDGQVDRWGWFLNTASPEE